MDQADKAVAASLNVTKTQRIRGQQGKEWRVLRACLGTWLLELKKTKPRGEDRKEACPGVLFIV